MTAFARRPFLVALVVYFAVALLGVAVEQRTPAFVVAVVVAVAVGAALSAPAEHAFVLASLVGMIVGGLLGAVLGGWLDGINTAPSPSAISFPRFNLVNPGSGSFVGLIAVQVWFVRHGALPGDGERGKGQR